MNGGKPAATLPLVASIAKNMIDAKKWIATKKIIKKSFSVWRVPQLPNPSISVHAVSTQIALSNIVRSWISCPPFSGDPKLLKREQPITFDY